MAYREMAAGHCPACKLRREGLEKYLEIKAEREKR